MSLLNWFSPRKKKKSGAHRAGPSHSALSRLEPLQESDERGADSTPSRKQERLERRELLYAVVRESMVRAGVLSSSYKFKVLSLDPRGRQFMVMVDLAQTAGSETGRLSEIEAMIAQAAKARHDIMVSAVYWRANEHVAVGVPGPAVQPVRPPQPAQPRSSRPAPLESSPAPLLGETSRPAELRSAPMRFDPLLEDEVTAFRKALAAGVRGEQALAAAQAGKTPQSYTLLTGFEDTEMPERGGGQEHLSTSQYGALR